jgi:hypothetical protein
VQAQANMSRILFQNHKWPSAQHWHVQIFSTAATVLAVEYSYLAKEMLVLGKLGDHQS